MIYTYVDKVIITKNHMFLISHEIKIENTPKHIIFHVGADTHKHDDVTLITPNCCKYFEIKVNGNVMLVDEFDPTKE